MSNIVAVALTLSLPRLYIVLKLLWPHVSPLFSKFWHEIRAYSKRLYVKMQQCWPWSRGPVSVTSPQVLSNLSSDIQLADTNQANVTGSSSRILSGAAHTLQESSSFGGAVQLLARGHLAMASISLGTGRKGFRGTCKQLFQNMLEDPKGFATILVIMLMFSAIFLGVQIASISSSFIVTTSTATSSNPSCGYWVPTLERPPVTEWIMRQVVLEKQPGLRAIRYAENCYSEGADLSQCNVFYNSSSAYNATHNVKCPFDQDVCLGGSNPAYTLDTGFLDSNVSGINSAARFQFRRRTTCAPLTTNTTYAKSYRNSLNQTIVDYYYGNEDGKPTFRDKFNDDDALKLEADTIYHVQYGLMYELLVDLSLTPKDSNKRR